MDNKQLFESMAKALGFFRVKEYKVKCSQCGTKFIVEGISEEDIKHFDLCPECNKEKEALENE